MTGFCGVEKCSEEGFSASALCCPCSKIKCNENGKKGPKCIICDEDDKGPETNLECCFECCRRVHIWCSYRDNRAEVFCHECSKNLNLGATWWEQNSEG